MIRRVQNMSNDKRNEIIAKIKQENFESNTRCHSIEFKIAKIKITCLDLNSYNYYSL